MSLSMQSGRRVAVLTAAILSGWMASHAGEDRPAPAETKQERLERMKARMAISAARLAENPHLLAARHALEQKVSVTALESPLARLIEGISDEQGVPIRIDEPTLLDEGVSLDTPVTLKVENITLRSALRLILSPLQLTTIFRDEALTVTTITRASEHLETKVYDVHRLLPRGDAVQLIDLLTGSVDPESWDEVGGPGSVRPFEASDALVIRQTEWVHAEIARLLDELAGRLDEPEAAAQADAPHATRAAEEAIARKLVARCNFKCEHRPLAEVLAELAQAHDLPLWVDRPALEDEGVSWEAGLHADMQNVRLESALSQILRPFQLTTVIEDEVLKVTTVTRATEILFTRVYDVRDLIPPEPDEREWPPRRSAGAMGGAGLPAGSNCFGGQPVGGGGFGGGGGFFNLAVELLRANHRGGLAGVVSHFLRQGFGGPGGGAPADAQGAVQQPTNAPPNPEYEELIETITSNVEPETWAEVGGAGSIHPFDRALIMRQTQQVHEGIEALLLRLTELAAAKPAPPPVDPPDPDAPVVVVYPLADYPPGELATLIPALIAPESWKPAGGTGLLYTQPQSLVVRQTPAVHRQIVKLLYEVVLHIKP